MSIKKFFTFFLIYTILFAAFKVVFFGNLDVAGSGIGAFVYLLLVAVLTAAVVRRLGVINFLEAVFVAFFWLVGAILLDLLIIIHIAGTNMLSERYFWFGYVVMVIFVLASHKKRHIHIRQEQHAAHHGKGHGPTAHADPKGKH